VVAHYPQARFKKSRRLSLSVPQSKARIWKGESRIRSEPEISRDTTGQRSSTAAKMSQEDGRPDETIQEDKKTSPLTPGANPDAPGFQVPPGHVLHRS
jgi:hypothetical protein